MESKCRPPQGNTVKQTISSILISLRVSYMGIGDNLIPHSSISIQCIGLFIKIYGNLRSQSIRICENHEDFTLSWSYDKPWVNSLTYPDQQTNSLTSLTHIGPKWSHMALTCPNKCQQCQI